MSRFDKIVAEIVAQAAGIDAINTAARFGQFAEAEKELCRNFDAIVPELAGEDPNPYISAAMTEIRAVARDMRPEIFDFEDCGRKTAVRIGGSQFDGSKFYRHDSGKLAVEASSWQDFYRDVDFDDYGRPYDCDHIATNVEARAWVRYERNPNTGKSWWVEIDSGYCDKLAESRIGAGTVALAKQLAKGELPEQLPDGWHEVPELDFGRDGRTCLEEVLYNDLPIASMFRAA